MVANILKVKHALIVISMIGVFAFSGCSKHSYPADSIKDDLLEICKKEYGIEYLDARIEGNTIGVYLPLKKLFSNNFKEALASGNVSGIENLFEPSPEALDKVEDVLFSISRVLLSTDRKVDFYILQATDIESTGLQLILKGAVDDIKRVRVWDISRNEYRKRVIHELRLNQAVIWHKPVRKFFEDLPQGVIEDLHKKYFNQSVPASILRTFFVDILPADQQALVNEWELIDIRSTELNQRSAVVYAKVKPQAEAGKKSSVPVQTASTEQIPEQLEYLFIVSLIRPTGGEITRVIPFQYRDGEGALKKIDFPADLQINENLAKWNEEFSVMPMNVGMFLAHQITRRVQSLVVADERIRNTLRDAKLEFEYNEAAPLHFDLNVDARLRHSEQMTRESLFQNEDMNYLLSVASREFVEVLRGYQFKSYDFLQVNLVQDPNPRILGREDLELFRRNKTDIKTLLSSFLNL